MKPCAYEKQGTNVKLCTCEQQGTEGKRIRLIRAIKLLCESIERLLKSKRAATAAAATATTCSVLMKQSLWFIQLKKGEQEKVLQSDSGFGLLLFYPCFPHIADYFPIVDLEFDCRGRVEHISSEGSSATYIITAGK